MPSGKKARQQRQQAAAAPPPVRSKGGPGGARQASPRTLAIAGGVIVAVIVAVVLGIVLTQNSSAKTDSSSDTRSVGIATTPAIGSSSNPNAVLYAGDIAKMFKGVPQSGLVLGKPNAPVTLVEYIDLQCPVCQQFETTELPTLVQKYVRTGKLKIEMKPWNILDAVHGSVDSLRGQKAVIGASDQNKAFNLAELLYYYQPANSEGTGWMTDGVLSNIAASVDGLKTGQLGTNANSSATAGTIKAIDDYANARPSIFSGTPTLLLAKGTGPAKLFYSGLPNLSALESAIQARAK
jgi:protein-disulfide isomerase